MTTVLLDEHLVLEPLGTFGTLNKNCVHVYRRPLSMLRSNFTDTMSKTAHRHLMFEE